MKPKKSLASGSRREPFCANGILEKFRDASVTLDANSMQCLKIKKHTTPAEIKTNAINFSIIRHASCVFRRIAANKAKMMTIYYY